MAAYKIFPRWKASVIFAVLQWLVSSIIVLILNPTTGRLNLVLHAGIFAVAAGVLYFFYTWFIGEKMKSVEVESPVEEEEKKEK